jgi:hypothetical protein
MSAVQIELDEFLRLSVTAAVALSASGFPLLAPATPNGANVDEEWLERGTGRGESLVLH